MISIEFDLAELEKRAQQVGASIDQVPFALALALNKAADVTRGLLIEQTWPQHVHMRNQSFIGASLTTKDARATKNHLDVEIYDRLDRGHLRLQAVGGERAPRGNMLAIGASANVPKTAQGTPSALKPRVLKNAFVKGDIIYQRVNDTSGRVRYKFSGAGKPLQKVPKGRLRLMYTLKSRSKVPERVPFFQDFEASMQRELEQAIPGAVAYAMATRRT